MFINVLWLLLSLLFLGIIMTEFKGIVQVGYDHLQQAIHTVEDIFVEKGEGREGVSFDKKVAEFEEKIKAGTMEKRDWKCRYNTGSPRIINPDWENPNGRSYLVVSIGPTSWQEWREDYNRLEQDAERLQQHGLNEHDDLGFYLSQGLGATVLTLTREGDVVVGIRSSDSYDGAIHGAAGWMEFHKDVNQISSRKDALRELAEELGVANSSVDRLDLIGLVAYPKTLEADFVYVAKTVVERDYFTSDAWKKAVDAREHRDLVILSNPDEIGRLLEEGRVQGSDLKRYGVLASTYYGLDVMMKNWGRFHR